MTILSDDSSVRAQVASAVWVGYKTPRHEIMGEKLPFKDMISAQGVSQEWTDEMMNTFQNGSLADFYDKYLGRVLTEKDHEKILLKADKILKTGLSDMAPTDDPLLTILSIDLAHNADEYGHHLFQTACFLNDQNQLPKEARFVLGWRMNPSLYPEKEAFEQAQKLLLEPTHKIPHEWAQKAFYKWMRTNDSAEYQAHMKEMVALEFVMSAKGTMPVERAIHSYIRAHYKPAYRHRQRLRRHNWRGRGE